MDDPSRSSFNIPLLVTVIVICLILSGLFSATETAFTSVNRVRVKTKADDGDKRANLVLKLIDRYDKLLSTILVGNNVVNILMSAMGTVLFIGLVGEDWGTIAATAAITLLVLVFGEVTPKTLAKEFPETFASFIAPFVQFLMVLLTPFTFVFAQWKKLLNLIFKNTEDTAITDDELLTIVDEAEQEGGIDAQEKELIKSAIEFNDVEAKDILIPRIDMVAVSDEADVTEVAAVFSETGYSRLPVYHETIDNIIGVLHEKDFNMAKAAQNYAAQNCVQDAVFVVSTTKISAVLKLLQKNKTHMAIVSGEFGETLGIITMEDILEELVGEIWDEHDDVVSDLTQLSETEYTVTGSMAVGDFESAFDVEIETESSTVGGWVIELLGKVPEEGDEATYQRYAFTVLETDTRRITKLKLVLQPVEEQED